MFNKKKYILFLLMFLLIYNAYSQDIHYSQFFASPLNSNPANTGNFDGDYRFVLNNKNQWLSFADAYRTFSLSFDAGFDNFLIKKSISGIGLQVNTDIAGSGDLMTNQIILNAGYYFPCNKAGNILLGVAIAPGYFFQNINFSRLTFGNQYVNNSFNSNINPDENFANSRINYFDISLGSNFIYNGNPNFKPYLGFSVFHLNQPKKSFSENSDRFLPIKYIVTTGANIRINEQLFVEPMLHFMFQQKYTEYNFGAMLKYEHSPVSFQALYFALMCRAKDAAIICFGGKYQNIQLLINYDINFSKLTNISKGKGGLELSLIYIFSRTKKIESPYYRKCPDFL